VVLDADSLRRHREALPIFPGAFSCSVAKGTGFSWLTCGAGLLQRGNGSRTRSGRAASW
jgi:hypothetical protein